MARVDGKMYEVKFRVILKENLLDAAKGLRQIQRFTFQQYWRPKDKARSTMEWFFSNHYVLERRNQSSDRNPVENLLLDLKIAAKIKLSLNYFPKKKDQPKKKLQSHI